MDKDKYFDYIYKPKSIYEKASGFIPGISAAYYPAQSNAKGKLQRMPRDDFYNSGLGKPIKEDWTESKIAQNQKAK